MHVECAVARSLRRGDDDRQSYTILYASGVKRQRGSSADMRPNFELQRTSQYPADAHDLAFADVIDGAAMDKFTPADVRFFCAWASVGATTKPPPSVAEAKTTTAAARAKKGKRKRRGDAALCDEATYVRLNGAKFGVMPMMLKH